VYDPAVELGDYVRYGGTVAGVLCAETAILSAGPRGELSAPDPAELADEYPYIGGTEKALTLAKAYAREAVDALDDDLTQQEIFNRLTDNGAAQGMVLLNGQLYINASYIHSGTLVLGGLNNQNGTMQVLDASGNVVGTWTKDGVAINKGSMTLTSILANHSVILSLAESQTEPFKIRSYGANVDYETVIRGDVIIAKNNVDGCKTQVSYNGVRFFGNNGQTIYLLDFNGSPELRLLSDHGNDICLGDNSYVISDTISLRSSGGISATAGGTLDLHSGGDASLYLTNTGHVEIRSDGGASYLQLKADGTIYVNNASEWRSALDITPANIGALGTGSLSSSVTDANNTGLYGTTMLSADSCSNLPTSTQGHYYEVAFMGTYQTAVLHSGSAGASRVYARYYANSQWYPWVRIDGLNKVSLSDVILASGTHTFSSLAAGAQTSYSISASIGTTNYIVLTQSNVSRCAIGIQNMAATGFDLYCRNVSPDTSSPVISWAAIAIA